MIVIFVGDGKDDVRDVEVNNGAGDDYIAVVEDFLD